jgi:ribose transport system substrate-binding protein
MKAGTAMNFKRWQIGALAVATMTSAACGSSASSSTTGSTKSAGAAKSLSSLSFAFASAGDSVGIFKTVGDGVVSDGTSLGIKIKRYDNNLDGPTALTNAGLIVQSKPDVAIDWNTQVGVGAAVGQQFTRSNTPCLAVNQQIPGCAWLNLSNQQMGVDAASVILPIATSRGWTGANTTVVMSVASANGVEVNNGPRYFYVQTANTLPGFTKVSPSQITASTTTIGGTNGIQIDCKSTLDGAYAAMQNVIGSIPKTNNVLLYGSDDDCSLGAYRSLKAAGFGNRILTGGLGADPDGLHLLRTDPNWVAEGALFFQDWGLYALSEAVAITQGVTPPSLTAIPQTMLTKANVDTYYDNNGGVKALPALVASNQYLAKYNILQKFAKVTGLN